MSKMQLGARKQHNTTAKLELESGAFLRSSAASSALARMTLAGGRARLPALTAHGNDAHGTKHGKAHRRERTRVPEPAPGALAFPGNKSRKPTKNGPLKLAPKIKISQLQQNVSR